MGEMTCVFCEIAVDATWLVAMGSAECTNVIEYHSCDIHMDVLRKAAPFTDDDCDPPHRIDEMIVWDAETKTQPETIYVHHESRDALSLTRALVPKYVECDDCGKRYRTTAEAVRCQQRDRSDYTAAYSIKPFPVTPAQQVHVPVAFAGCKSCGRRMVMSKTSTSDICAACVTVKLRGMMKRMKNK